MKDCRLPICINQSLWTRFLAMAMIFVLFRPPAVLSEPHLQEEQSPWSGRVELGILAMATTSRLVCLDSDDYPGLSNDFTTLDSLEENHHYEQVFNSFLLFNVNYQLNDTSSAYLGTPFFDDTRQGLTAGVQKLMANDNLVDASVFIDTTNIWKDPFETHVTRELTQAYTYGGTLDTDGLFGLPFHINIMTKCTRVIDDEAGRNFGRLRRDGYTHRLITGYNFYLDESFESVFKPSFIYTRDDRKGGANTYNGYGIELAYSTEWGRHAFMMAGGVAAARYEEDHPIFIKRRNDINYTFECFFTRRKLWDRNWYLRVGCGYESTNSNIGFYSESNILYGVSLGYSFE